MAEIKVEISEKLLRNSERIQRRKQIKMEIKNEIKEEELDEPQFPTEFPEVENLLEEVPSTSEAVDVNDKRLDILMKMRKNLPRTLKVIHKQLGLSNNVSEIPRDQLTSMIADEYLKGFDEDEKEKYRFWFEDEEYQKLIQTNVDKYSKNSSKRHSGTGLEVNCCQETEKKRKNNQELVKCVVCNFTMNPRYMKKILFTNASIRNEYKKLLGSKILEKKRVCYICGKHFPGGKIPQNENILPNRISREEQAKLKTLNQMRKQLLESIRENLPETLQQIKEKMKKPEISRDQLNRMIKMKCLKDFNSHEKEMCRCWFDDDEWKSVIRAEIRKNFKKTLIVNAETGTKVRYFRKLFAQRSGIVKKSLKGVYNGVCIVCDVTVNTKKMKFIPICTEKRNEWIRVLGPNLAAKLTQKSYMCKEHYPEGEYVPFSSVVPSRIVMEPIAKHKPVVSSKNALPPVIKLKSSNKKQIEIRKKLCNDLPDMLREIFEKIKEDEVTRKELDSLIKERCMMGMTEPQKRQCRGWLATPLWKASIQEQIDVYFESFKRRNAKTRTMVEYVKKLHSPSEMEPELVEADVVGDLQQEVPSKKRRCLRSVAPKCIGCQGEHNFNQCEIMSLEEKYEMVQRLNLCVVCGKKATDDHTAAACGLKSGEKLCEKNACQKMGSSHSPSLCFISIILRDLPQST